jgi:hypothetical protein
MYQKSSGLLAASGESSGTSGDCGFHTGGFCTIGGGLRKTG